MSQLAKLISLGGIPLGSVLKEGRLSYPECERLARQVAGLLGQRNGFYAFEGALHIYPLGSAGDHLSLEVWNGVKLWRHEYKDLAEGCLFFAEDVFGNQFCIYKNGVHLFDAETGEKTEIASDLEGWAKAILSDFKLQTGAPIAHSWQTKNGRIPNEQRLIPKTPFVCGGSYELDNLFALDSIRGMKSRGNLARQLRDLPDGSKITFKIVD